MNLDDPLTFALAVAAAIVTGCVAGFVLTFVPLTLLFRWRDRRAHRRAVEKMFDRLQQEAEIRRQGEEWRRNFERTLGQTVHIVRHPLDDELLRQLPKPAKGDA